MKSEQHDAESASFAARLDHLFRSVGRSRGGKEPSYREVAAAIAAQGGATISASYLQQLRSGVNPNPTKQHMEALAQFFGVPAAYFLDDRLADEVNRQLDLLNALKDQGVRALALRAQGLSDESLKLITDLVERTRALEGLGERSRSKGSATSQRQTYEPRPHADD